MAAGCCRVQSWRALALCAGRGQQERGSLWWRPAQWAKELAALAPSVGSSRRVGVAGTLALRPAADPWALAERAEKLQNFGTLQAEMGAKPTLPVWSTTTQRHQSLRSCQLLDWRPFRAVRERTRNQSSVHTK